mmetsp:Transcript_31105/g.51376  ORF Transcript_31105/g.51376 Transcript_31105/m.51376 type:complete len:212 (-) Transcript_31105:62-697(-)|eukprot:CAMPEP_0119003132 /NCGR_PEP_ID=MMETSP1176-20130426/377_1 /TAXON_ID=265551 /ORGANISM="Synedropsis recta cf, Strain CCMP1620" /LENGTH=211 /DNA_ID=CAMNT_0006954701 /DNA_START=164 /DNA_END=799 /DNA_ORIENTATION=+
MAMAAATGDYYRTDGVRILHDPYAAGVAEKYGIPGRTDKEGFNPYADTVGAGIYGGSVKRDEVGNVLLGQQYQNHNRSKGPVYDGNGYSLMSRAIHAGPNMVQKLVSDFPELKEEVSTGGARPLHMCGMSRQGQESAQILIDAGADIYARDTYGYTALHRMGSNDLAIGGEALVKAGMDPGDATGADESPLEIAKLARSRNFIQTMNQLGY